MNHTTVFILIGLILILGLHLVAGSILAAVTLQWPSGANRAKQVLAEFMCAVQICFLMFVFLFLFMR